uniref:GM05554p n=1 Tax=Drosophila melanogaster TaxID=7227 RepID=Q95S91_DROME|nr:GM05554p [Drosophila melanogaster]
MLCVLSEKVNLTPVPIDRRAIGCEIRERALWNSHAKIEANRSDRRNCSANNSCSLDD